MLHSESLDKLIPALIKAQSAVEAVAKSANNPHYKSLYMPFDAVLAAIKPALEPNGLAVVFSMENADESGADVVTTVLHISGQWRSCSLRMPFEKATAQGACTALTYGSRRGLAALFAVAADPDDDGHLLESFPVQHNRPQGAPKAAPVYTSTVTGTPKAAPAASSTPKPYSAKNQSAAFSKIMPFGKFKGATLGSLEVESLRSTASWCRDTDTAKFQSLIDDLETVAAAKDEFANPPAALEPETGEIPF